MRGRGEVVEYLREATCGSGRGRPADAPGRAHGDIQVRDIMVPRAQMTVLNRGDVELLLRRWSRAPFALPVMDEAAKRSSASCSPGLVALAAQDDDAHFIKEFMRPRCSCPNPSLQRAVARIRRSRVHMAIVADECSGIAGLVTIEDVIEQIIGDIDDEHDVDEDVNIRRTRGAPIRGAPDTHR